MEGDTVAQTRQVSRKWYNQIKEARTARDRVTNLTASNNTIHRIGIGPTDRTIGGLESHGVYVTIEEGGSEEGIPAEVGDVPVIVEEGPDVNSGCYTGYRGPIEGGIGCYSNANSEGNGTLCCRVHKGGTKYMMSARHLFTDNGTFCSDDNTNGTIWYQGGGDEAGEVDYEYQNHDCVLLDLSRTGRNAVNTIVSESGRVVGRVTEDGVGYLISNDKTVQSRGRTPCSSSGQPIRYHVTIACYDDYIGNVVRSDVRFDDGDSGGPVYYEEYDSTDRLYIVHIATHYPGDPPGDAMGSATYAMHNKRGIDFGWDAYDGG